MLWVCRWETLWDDKWNVNVGQDKQTMELWFVKIHVEHLLETKLHKPNGHRFPNHALIGFQSMPL